MKLIDIYSSELNAYLVNNPFFIKGTNGYISFFHSLNDFKMDLWTKLYDEIIEIGLWNHLYSYSYATIFLIDYKDFGY